MAFTDPKRLFSEMIDSGGTTVTADDKWIITDLWITNAKDVSVRFTIEHNGSSLFNKTVLDPNSTMIGGNIILDDGDDLYMEVEEEEVEISGYGRVV